MLAHQIGQLPFALCSLLLMAYSMRICPFRSQGQLMKRNSLKLQLNSINNNYYNDYVLAGCTGVLGKSLYQLLHNKSQLQHNIYATYRCENRIACIKNMVNYPNSKDNRMDVRIGRRLFFLTNFKHSQEFQPTINAIMHAINISQSTNIKWINNAAICLFGQSQEIMQETLFVNTIFPIYVMKTLLAKAKQHELNSCNIINISSGDGELCYLHSSIRNDIESISSIQDLENYISNRLITNFNSNLEYAYGNTPCYSLSKALLNKASRLLSNEIDIKCICPGNFISPVTTSDDNTASDQMITPNEAAKYVLEACDNIDGKFKSGKFYRFGQEINW